MKKMQEKQSKRGGAREGSGRPKLSESGRIRVQFSLQQFEIDLIKELAEKNGTNKSRFIMQCVDYWKQNH